MKTEEKRKRGSAFAESVKQGQIMRTSSRVYPAVLETIRKQLCMADVVCTPEDKKRLIEGVQKLLHTFWVIDSYEN